MPFQSEKQRRYLHANHPEIAKRWERDYADGGITRIPLKKGSYSRSYNPGAGGVVQHGPVKTKTPNNGGGGPPSVVHKPTGPTAAEIAAAKAKAEAEKRALEAAASKKYVKDFKNTQKKKLKYHPLFKQKTQLPPSQGLGIGEVPSDINLKFKKDTADAFKIGNIAATWNIQPSSLIKLLKEPHSVDLLRGMNLVDSPENQTGFEKQGLSSDYRHTLGTSAFKDSIIDYLSKNLNLSPNNKALNAIGSATAKGATIFEEGKDAFRALDTYNKEYPPRLEYQTLSVGEILAQPKEDFEANWFAADQIPYGTKPEEKMNMVKAYREYGIDNYKDQLAKEKKMDMQETIADAENKFNINEWLMSSNLAKGGVARKKYSTGSNGILDIDEESEDISLTSFNPNFDEIPQLTDEEQLQIDSEDEEEGEKRIDLFSETQESDPLNELLLAEDGVTTLFRAKNGGNATKNIKGQPHMLAYITPGEAKTLENLGGQKTITKEGIPAYPPSDNYGGTHGGSNNFSGMDSGGWDPGVSSPGTTSSGGNVNTGSGDQEDDVAQMMHDMSLTPDNAPDYTGSDRGWVVSEDEETEIGGADYASITQIQERAERRKANYKKQQKKDAAWFGIKALFLGLNPYGLYNFAKKQDAKKQEYLTTLEEDIQALKDMGVPMYNPHTNTLVQTLEQEYLDLIQPKSKDEDTGGDGPEPVAPVMEEIKDYTETAWDPMSYLDKIRAGQAQRASLQAKGIIQDNEIMTLNSGGLANLFRVKNY